MRRDTKHKTSRPDVSPNPDYVERRQTLAAGIALQVLPCTDRVCALENSSFSQRLRLMEGRIIR